MEHLSETDDRDALKRCIEDLSPENLGNLLETLPPSEWQAHWQGEARKHLSEAMVLFAALISLLGLQAIGLASPPLVIGGMCGILARTSFIWAGESIVVSVGRSLQVVAIVAATMMAGLLALSVLGALLVSC